MINPVNTFYQLVKLCSAKLEDDMVNIAKEQERLEAYKAKNPTNVLQINSWQEVINSKVDVNEYLQECITEHFPACFDAEAKRKFLKGREFEKNDSSTFTTYYKNNQHKEAIRHYSIAEQRLKDNI